MMKLKKKVILVAYVMVCVALLCACNNNGNMKNEYAGKPEKMNKRNMQKVQTRKQTQTGR